MALQPLCRPGRPRANGALVQQRRGRAAADDVVAAYYIAGMGHGGKAYDDLLGAQLEALERWIDYRQSAGGAAPRHPIRWEGSAVTGSSKPSALSYSRRS